MATDETSEQHQRPETAEQRRHREEAAFQADIRECGLENARRLRALRSDPILWAFVLETVKLINAARDTGSGSGDDPTGLPLSSPQLALCDRVLLCQRMRTALRRMIGFAGQGHGFFVAPQYGPETKEEGR